MNVISLGLANTASKLLLLGFGASVVVPAPVTSGVKPAGSARKQRKYVVEIDGALHYVESREQAAKLLRAAVRVAKVEAPKEIAAASTVPEIEKVTPPAIIIEPEAFDRFAGLMELWQQRMREIQSIYDGAARDYAVTIARIRDEQEEDDAEALMALLH